MYLDFQNSMKDFVVFRLSSIRKAFPNFSGKNLVNWQMKGYVNKLKNVCYKVDVAPFLFNPADEKRVRLFEEYLVGYAF